MILDIKKFVENSYRYLSDDVVALLIISELHLQKKINDVRMKAMVRSHRKGILLRGLNTYHCPIDGKWYNDTSMITVLTEIYNNNCKNTYRSIDDIIPYVQLLKNSNKNYAIDYLYTELAEPFLRNSKISNYSDYAVSYSTYSSFMLKSFDIENKDIVTFYDADNKGWLGFGYCCEDCDGDYGAYKWNEYIRNYSCDNWVDYFKAEFRKHKTHLRNPNDKLI